MSTRSSACSAGSRPRKRAVATPPQFTMPRPLFSPVCRCVNHIAAAGRSPMSKQSMGSIDFTSNCSDSSTSLRLTGARTSRSFSTVGLCNILIVARRRFPSRTIYLPLSAGALITSQRSIGFKRSATMLSARIISLTS